VLGGLQRIKPEDKKVRPKNVAATK
jgi:hypothetical protein